MKPEMYYKLMQAWKLPDGTYTLHKKKLKKKRKVIVFI